MDAQVWHSSLWQRQVDDCKFDTQFSTNFYVFFQPLILDQLLWTYKADDGRGLERDKGVIKHSHSEYWWSSAWTSQADSQFQNASL